MAREPSTGDVSGQQGLLQARYDPPSAPSSNGDQDAAGLRAFGAPPSLAKLGSAPPVQPPPKLASFESGRSVGADELQTQARIQQALAVRFSARGPGSDQPPPVEFIQSSRRAASADASNPSGLIQGSAARTGNGTIRGFIAGVVLAMAAGPLVVSKIQDSLSERQVAKDERIELDVDSSAQPRPSASTDALVRPTAPQQVHPSQGDHIAQLRLKYPDIPLRLGKDAFVAPHPVVRIAVAKQAAREARLQEVGLTWRDVYAIIHAESSWVSRDGMGLNGKTSRGVAQLEDATARGLGVKDPYDMRQGALAAALLAKEGSVWARAKRHELHKEAISVYYNTSTRLRNQWDGSDLDALPEPTQRHIENVAQGLKIAAAQEVRWARDLREAGLQEVTKQARVKRRVAAATELPRGAKNGALSGLSKGAHKVQRPKSHQAHQADASTMEAGLRMASAVRQSPIPVHNAGMLAGPGPNPGATALIARVRASQAGRVDADASVQVDRAIERPRA